MEAERTGSKEVEAGVPQTWVHLTAAGFEEHGIVASFPLSDDSNPHLSYDQVMAAATQFVTREDGAVVMSLTLPVGPSGEENEKVVVTETTLFDAMVSDMYKTDPWNRHIYLHVEASFGGDAAHIEESQIYTTENQESTSMSSSSREPAPYCMAPIKQECEVREEQEMQARYCFTFYHQSMDWLKELLTEDFRKAVPQVAAALLEMRDVLLSMGIQEEGVQMSEECQQLLLAVAMQVNESNFEENTDVLMAAGQACMVEWLKLSEPLQQMIRAQMTEVCKAIGAQLAAERAPKESKCPASAASKCPHAKKGCTRADAPSMSEGELNEARAACPHARASDAAKEADATPKVKSTVWGNVVCDGCEMFPIVGHRYKCLAQDNTDLCETCYQRLVPEQRIEGMWEKLGVIAQEDMPVDIYAESPEEEKPVEQLKAMVADMTVEELKAMTVWGNVQCDGCNEFPIIGARYRCLAQDDTDLCSACFGRLVPEQRHCFEEMYKTATGEIVAAPVEVEDIYAEEPAPAAVCPFNPPPRVESEAETESEPAPQSEKVEEARVEEARESVESVPQVFDMAQADTHSIEDEYEMHNENDDVLSASDITTEVSVTFAVAEDDANVMLLELDANNENADVIERMRQSNDFLEVTAMMMPSVPFAPALMADVLGYSMHGVSIMPPMLEDWQLFRSFMEGMRAHVGEMGVDKCVYLGSVGKEGAVAELMLQNSSDSAAWPTTTKLMRVHGDGCGFGDLQLNAVEPGQPAAIVMDFPALGEGALYTPGEFSFWILSANEGESAFGNMVCVRRC